MTREFIILPSFQAKWNDLGLNDDDLNRLEEDLIINPKVGPILKGSGGIRKMRFAFPNKGKSGSPRIIYVDFEVFEKVYFLNVFQKSQMDDISDSELNDLRRIVRFIELSLRKGREVKNE